MAEHFTNSIGCLQQNATPTPFPGFGVESGTTPEQPPEGKASHLFI